MISVILNGTNITGMVSKVEWAGNGEEVARTCDIDYVNAPYDPNVKNLPTPCAGDYVTVLEDGNELFYGRCQGTEKSSAYGTLTANCIEDSNTLVNVKVKYSFTNKTAEEITSLILADYGFSCGDLASTGVNIKSFVADGISIYDAIQNAYAEAKKTTHEEYLIRMVNRALTVEVSGSRTAAIKISEATNITESKYTETIDSLVNRVIMYDSEGNRIGEVGDTESQSKYGVYQEIYKQSDNDTDPNEAAKDMLTKPDQSLNITAIGESSCTSGAGIVLADSATGQYGLYWIKNDTHTFENGTHMMKLELSFQKLTSKDAEDD